MTAVSRHVPLALFVLAGALAVMLALDAVRTAGAAPPDAIAAPSAPPVLHDPAAAPLDAWDDIVAARKIGWPALVFAVGTMLAVALGTLGTRYPRSRLAWLNRGAMATIIGATVACGSAGYNSAAQGGTWLAAAFAAMLALAAFWQAKRPIVERNTEAGHAAPPLLVIIAGAGFTILAGMAGSCADAKHALRAGASDAIDCTIATAKADADRYGGLLERVIRDAIRDGKVQVAEVKAALKDFAATDVQCFVALTFARLMSHESMSLGPDPVRAAWEEIRASMGGRRYLVGHGAVL